MMDLKRIFCVIFILWTFSVVQTFDVNDDIYFELYTSENPDNYQVIKNVRSIENTAFDPQRPTRIFIHGFRSVRDTIKQYSRKFLKAGNINFIAMNWIDGAETLVYPIARNRVEEGAHALAELIEGLVKAEMSLSDLVVIGHSLGAHIAGLTGKKFTTNGRIGAIVGLDPAAVLFNVNETEYRLAKTDANYVQVIHTDIEGGGLLAYGIGQPLGHGDFYPNYGRLQPGCLQDIKIPIVNVNVEIPTALRSLGNRLVGCSHGRAHEFFLESLSTHFPSIQCTDYQELAQNKCTVTGVTANMGGDFSSTATRPHGIFYLETKPEAPYAISDVNKFENIEINMPNKGNGWLTKSLDVARSLLKP